MTKKPVISIVIPSCNPGKLLLRSVRSVLAQTYQDYEIIIADDGSNDSSGELIKTLQLDNLYYYRLEHKNANVAGNYGILHSKGKYIAMLDADDEWFRNHLEVNMELMMATECDGIYSSIEMRTPHKNIRAHGEMFSRLNGKSCEEIYNGIFPDISAWQCVGFKMFYYHPHDSDDSTIWELMRNDRNFKIIHLQRNNLLWTKRVQNIVLLYPSVIHAVQLDI